MRVFAQCAAVGLLAVGFVVPGPAGAQTKDAASIIAAARQAERQGADGPGGP